MTTGSQTEPMTWPDHPIPEAFFTANDFDDHSMFKPSFETMLKQYSGPQQWTNYVTSRAPLLERLTLEEKTIQDLQGLESLKLGYNYPHHSQLTVGLFKYYLYLQHKYGNQRHRVVTEAEAKEHKQWMNLQKQITSEQEEYQTFAKQVAMSSADDFIRFLPGAEAYMNKYLDANRARVLCYPRLYRMNQSVNLQTDPVKPSDPQLILLKASKFQEDLHFVSCKNLRQKLHLCREKMPPIHPDTHNDTCSLSKEGCQEDADIVISVDALSTLVDNHDLEKYPHQWEIPFTVKTNEDTGNGAPSKTVILEDPLTKHNYYPYEANKLQANKQLKHHLERQGRSIYSKDKNARKSIDLFKKTYCIDSAKEVESFTFDDDITALETLGSGSFFATTAKKGTPSKTVKARKEYAKINFVKSKRTQEEEKRDLLDSVGSEILQDSLAIRMGSDTVAPTKLLAQTDATTDLNVQTGSISGNKVDDDICTQSKDNEEVVVAMETEHFDKDENNSIEENSEKMLEAVTCDDKELVTRRSKEAIDSEDSKPEESKAPELSQVLTRKAAKKRNHQGNSQSEADSMSDSSGMMSPPRVKGQMSRMTRSATRKVKTEQVMTGKRRTRSSSISGEELEQLSFKRTKNSKESRKSVQKEKDQEKESGMFELPNSEEVSHSGLQGSVTANTGSSDEIITPVEKTDGLIVEKLSTKDSLEEKGDCPVINVAASFAVDNAPKFPEKSSESESELRIDFGEDEANTEVKVVLTKVPQMKLRMKMLSLEGDEATKGNVNDTSTTKGGNGGTSPTVNPLLNNIMQLKNKLIASKKGSVTAKKEPKAAVEMQQASGSLVDNILQDQTKLLTKMKTDVVKSEMIMLDGAADKVGEENEKANTSLWKIGKLRMCIRGGVDGLYWDQGQKAVIPATVHSKLEQQPWFGFEQVSMGEMSRLWLNAAIFPHSVIIRGRIHCHSSNVMKWEVLNMNNIGSGSQFQPTYATKILHNVFTKLLDLSDGSYLLIHHPGDPQAFIYSTVKEETAHRFIIYDLHSQHQKAKIHNTPPTDVPWAPLDPNLPLTGSQQWSIACIFPPPPYMEAHEYYKTRRFNPHDGIMAGQKKKKKKKHNKKTSNKQS